MTREIACRMRKVKGMRLGARVGLLAVLTILVTASSAVAAAPATADSASSAGCARSFSFGGAKAEIDNCPGNGRAGWGWIYGSPSYSWSTAYVKLANGQQFALSANSHETSTAGWDSPVRGISLCNHWWVGWAPPVPVWKCSVEVPV